MSLPDPRNVRLVYQSSSEDGAYDPLFLDIWAVNKFFEYNSYKDHIVPQLEVGDEVWLKRDTQGYSHVLLYIGGGEVVHVSDVQKSGLSLGKTIVVRYVDKMSSIWRSQCYSILKLDDIASKMILELKDLNL